MEKFLQQIDGYSTFYSTIAVIGATKTQVELFLKKIPDYESKVANGTYENGIVCFDLVELYPEEICLQISNYIQDAIVFGRVHWDFSDFYAYQNGEVYDQYTAEFINGTPRLIEEEEDEDLEDLVYGPVLAYDCDIRITDKTSGYQFLVGGGMCSTEEKDAYQYIVSQHPVKESKE